MDYKEKYEQALERARQFSEKPYLEDSAGIVEYIFPELKESEDDRIRKELIKGFKESGWTHFSDELTINDAITWLEKQGGHARFREAIQVGDQVTKNEDGVLVNLSQLKRVAKPSEKQGEQKPAWSKEDEYYLNSCITKIEIDIQNWEGHGKTMIDVDKEIISWLKSLKNRILPQPKQEWSEEDEKNIETLINVLYAGTDLAYEREINWLKFLKERAGCEADCTTTKEWSEDDDSRLKEVLYYIEYINRTNVTFQQRNLTHLINWLKSFKGRVQPQPKQEWSEEDEKKINNILNVLIDYKELESEYYWLKSLRPQNRCAYNPYKEVVESIAEMCKHYDNMDVGSLQDLLGKLRTLRKTKTLINYG